jgi:tRNA (guanine-N(7)-)-methyltransferase
MPIRTHDPFADLLQKISPDKNPFVQKMISAQDSGSLPVAFGPALKSFPGQWRQKISSHLNVSSSSHSASITSETPLIVEIGCHYGHTLVELAKAHQNTLFVGIDITFKRVINTAERAKNLGLNNVFVILANARGLAELFAPREVSGFVTFFPDPWVKKKHAHNRLYTPKFCETAREKLEQNGFLWLKTDQEPYFQDASKHAKDAGFVEAQTLRVLGDKDYSSVFMRRYELKGLPWYGNKWTKQDA